MKLQSRCLGIPAEAGDTPMNGSIPCRPAAQRMTRCTVFMLRQRSWLKAKARVAQQPDWLATSLLLLLMLGSACIAPHRTYTTEADLKATTDNYNTQAARNKATGAPGFGKRSQLTYNYPKAVVESNPELGNNLTFAVIEFTDQGQLWDRTQFNNALQQIKSLKATAAPLTLVVFAHGWNQDASPYSGNFKSFHQLMTSLAADNARPNELRARAAAPRNYMGVYLAWRGKSLRFEHDNGFNQALAIPTFWSRLGTAKRIAGVSSTEVILSLSVAAKTEPLRETGSPREATLPPKPDPANGSETASRVVIVGHSMGGLVVESAMSQAILGGIFANAGELNSFIALQEEGRQQLGVEKASLQTHSQLLAQDLVAKDKIGKTLATLAADLGKKEAELNKTTNATVRTKLTAELSTLKTEQTNQLQQASSLTASLTIYSNKVSEAKAKIATLDAKLQALKETGEARSKATTRPIADLVVCVNPASQALVAYKMVEAFQNPLLSKLVPEIVVPDSPSGNKTTPWVRPWLISISSDGDWATRVLAPIGFIMPGLSQVKSGDTNRVSERRLLTHTAPHLKEIVSHELRLKEATNVFSGTECGRILQNDYTDILNRNRTNDLEFAAFYTTVGVFELQQVEGKKQSGYWVIKADSALIKDHGDIFTDRFYAVLGGLLRISERLHRSEPPNGNGATKPESAKSQEGGPVNAVHLSSPVVN